MSFASLRRVLRSARKGLCSTCSRTKYPQLEAAGAGHVGCLIYTFETLDQLIRDEHDVTAMHVAARKGQISILIYLIENNLVKTIPRAKNGATPAHDAAGTGNLECLRYILGHTKARANDTDNNSATPLHWAVQSGHLKVVQWLVVEAKSPIDALTSNGVTSIHIAAAKNYLDIVRWLVLHAYRHYPKPRRLMNAKDRNGATPLYHAAHAGHVEIIRWIAEKGGGDPTIVSGQGLAPLHAATIAGHVKAVQYLFQFGSATAPGGLRTPEGASALHFAAADGWLEILKWLLEQKECTGNERDYYQSTPMHDAAEHGHLKVIQALCEHGADKNAMDIEGNTPKDLAEKSRHNKCAKFLVATMKQKVTRGMNGSVARGPNHSRGVSRTQQPTDVYGNAPPHQLPVNVFEDEEMDVKPHGDEQWETLHDLMDEQEIKELESLSKDSKQQSSRSAEAAEKRRKLEENLRREAEERKMRRAQLLKKEQEVEKGFRERLLAEENEEIEPEQHRGALRWKKVKKKKKGDKSNDKEIRRLSLPANLQSDGTDQLTQRGLVERRTKEFELRTPEKGSKKIFSKLWPGKRSSAPGNLLQHSQSWDSSLSRMTSTSDAGIANWRVDEDEENLPEPPPLPTIDYLLGKRPANLRGKANVTLEEEVREKAAAINTESDDGTVTYIDSDNDSDSHSSHSSVSSTHSERKHKKKKKKKRKSQKGESTDANVQWTYNKLSVPQSSPPRERKFYANERMPTPIPMPTTTGNLPTPRKLDFDTKQVASPTSPQSPSYPPDSLSPRSPTSPPSSQELSPAHRVNEELTGYLKPARAAPPPPGNKSNLQNRTAKTKQTTAKTTVQPSTSPQKATSSIQPKRAAPKLLPHVQNRQKQNANATTVLQSLPPRQTKASPIAKLSSSRKSQGRTATKSATTKVTRDSPSNRSPNEFMAALNNAVASSPSKPAVVRQMGRNDSHSPSSSPGTHSPTIDEIELHLDAMKSTLAGAALQPRWLSQRPPSPQAEEQEDSDTDSSEYTSSSDDSSSDSDTSSDDSSDDDGMVAPKRPIMARNPSMERAKSYGGFNRARFLARYPRLLRKRVVRLPTIKEVPEEIIYTTDDPEQRAVLFYRLHMQKRHIKAWRRYMQMMKSAYRKAEKMAQRRRRDLLAKSFYAWVQVRNMGAVAKDNVETARIYYERKLLRKMLDAWLFHKMGAKMPTARSTSLQLLTAEERYLTWFNGQLLGIGKAPVEDISESLASGVLIILAVAHASGVKPPKYNANPKVRLHRQDNWKVAHEYMKSLGVNVKGIEPADLANILPAAIHNMFNVLLKWQEKQAITAL